MVESMKMDEAMSYYRCFPDLSLDLYRETSLVEVLRNVAIGYGCIGWWIYTKKVDKYDRIVDKEKDKEK